MRLQVAHLAMRTPLCSPLLNRPPFLGSIVPSPHRPARPCTLLDSTQPSPTPPVVGTLSIAPSQTTPIARIRPVDEAGARECRGLNIRSRDDRARDRTNALRKQ